MNNHTRYPLVAVPGALAEVPAEVLGVALVVAVAIIKIYPVFFHFPRCNLEAIYICNILI